MSKRLVQAPPRWIMLLMASLGVRSRTWYRFCEVASARDGHLGYLNRKPSHERACNGEQPLRHLKQVRHRRLGLVAIGVNRVAREHAA